MANTDIRLKLTLFGHRKWKALGRAAGYKGQVGLIRLWAWTAAYYPRGELVDVPEDEIEEVVGGPEVLEALVSGGWLDVCGSQSGSHYKVHDWREHQGYAYHAPERSEAARYAANARHSRRKSQRRKGKGKRAGRNAGRNADRNAPAPAPAPAPTAGQGRGAAAPAPLEGGRGAQPVDGWTPTEVTSTLASLARASGGNPEKPAPELRDVLGSLAHAGASPIAVRQAADALEGRLPKDPGGVFSLIRGALRLPRG